MAPPDRQPFSLTYVSYTPGDKVGLLCALLALAPVFIIVAYATLFVSRREAHLIWMLIGQLLNVALNAALKAAIGQPRPPGADHDGMGMPSDHAQFMGFWACYGALFLAIHVPRLGRSGWRSLLILAMCVLALAVAASRVYLGYHTVAQISVGLGVGSAVSFVWFAMYTTWLRPCLGAWVSNSAVCRYLLIRDAAHIDDLLTFEYDAIMRKVKCP
uniref:Dolichyldiphosphatase n=1 Tax=Haptolina ericina TaxID=156174 RepID=A0A7S3AJC8_9EUKA|mmetsp:Transcript_21402/g.48212  ORF Transcript_21402/g.48212 Transcript_21402/m.48212 type:complete len:215 (+) Transcript_21402:52-696(+)